MLIFLFLLLTSCTSESEVFFPEKILGRKNEFLYQITLTKEWVRQDQGENKEDTMTPIASFQNGDLLMTIYNFPDIKIPPVAQIQRWQKQINEEGTIENQTFSGFQGLLLESDHLLAWALETCPSLRLEGEKKADVTIKITGPIEGERDSLIRMARTFEFIEDVPCAQ